VVECAREVIMRDLRSAREKIADALIPEHQSLLRAAYLLGNDAVLLRFLSIPGYDESVSQRQMESRYGAELPDRREPEPLSADLIEFAQHHQG